MTFGNSNKKDKNKGKGSGNSFGGAGGSAILAAIAGGNVSGLGFATTAEVQAAQDAADAAAQAAAQAAADAQTAIDAVVADAVAEEATDTTQEATTDAEQATQDSDIADNAAALGLLENAINQLSASQITQDNRLDAVEAQLPDDDSSLQAQVDALEERTSLLGAELDFSHNGDLTRPDPTAAQAAVYAGECTFPTDTADVSLTISAEAVSGTGGVLILIPDTPGTVGINSNQTINTVFSPGDFVSADVVDFLQNAEELVFISENNDLLTDTELTREIVIPSFTPGGTFSVVLFASDGDTVTNPSVECGEFTLPEEYDDTAVVARLDAVEAQLPDDDTALVARLDAIEAQLPDDDSALVARLDAIELQLPDDDSALETRLDAIEAQLPDDDSALQTQIDENLFISNLRSTDFNAADMLTDTRTNVPRFFAATSNLVMDFGAGTQISLQHNGVATTETQFINIPAGSNVFYFQRSNVNAAVPFIVVCWSDAGVVSGLQEPGQVLVSNGQNNNPTYAYPFGFERQQVAVDEIVNPDNTDVVAAALQLPALVGGTYSVVAEFGWALDATTNNIEVHLNLDGVEVNNNFRQEGEPQDAAGAGGGGTDQNIRSSITLPDISFTAGDTPLFELVFSADTLGVQSALKGITLTFMRVGD